MFKFLDEFTVNVPLDLTALFAIDLLCNCNMRPLAKFPVDFRKRCDVSGSSSVLIGQIAVAFANIDLVETFGTGLAVFVIEG